MAQRISRPPPPPPASSSSSSRSGIAGDPVKFGLGLMSMVYDVVFMVQHYCLFAGSADGRQQYETVEEEEAVDDVGASTAPRKARG